MIRAACGVDASKLFVLTMKVLILSWYFPPANDVAALRVGKLAEYLHGAGHEVSVLTSARDHSDQSLPLSLPSNRVLRTSWFDVQHLRFHRAPRQRNEFVSSPSRPGADVVGLSAALRKNRPARPRLVQSLNELYMNIVELPDKQVGWLPYLLPEGRKLLREKSVDLIYASGPPFTTFLAAKSLSRRFSVPWIAEYRDAWSRYVYTPKPKWRQALDERIENIVSPTASGIVAVSEPWAEYYRKRYGLPTAAIYNGFDSDCLLPAPRRTAAPDEPVTITYLGVLYQGLRNPSLLYEAIKRSCLSPKDVRISYYGPKAAEVYPLAAKYGVSDFIAINERIPYQRSLEIQRSSDVLLLLQSPDDPRNVPAKVFEYFASCRPILGLGLDNGIPARLVRERNAGFYTSNVDAIATQLTHWVAEKRTTGLIPDVPSSARAGLSRLDQFANLEIFMRSLV